MSRTTTLKGNPMDLAGPELKAGDAAPDATVKINLVQEKNLSEICGGKARVYSVVPSLDTPVCADQTRRFHEEAGKMENVDFFTISVDLPPAQARFCGAESFSNENLHVLSDHLKHDFGEKYGTYVPSLGILCRAVFVVGPDDTLTHVEYVGEVAEHPNYDAALEAARALA